MARGILMYFAKEFPDMIIKKEKKKEPDTLK